MASTSTPNLDLFKPTAGTFEPFRVSDFNENMDKIDQGHADLSDAIDVVAADLAELEISGIADGAVTEAKIADGAVTNAKLAASGLSASKLTTGTLPVGQLPDHSTDKLTSGTLPIARGGTGSTTKSGARQNIGIYVQETTPTGMAAGDLWFW